MRWNLPFGILALAIANAPVAAFAQRTPADAVAASDFATRVLVAADRHKAILDLALERTKNADVRRFTETLAQDLAKAIQKLRDIAGQQESAPSRPAVAPGVVPEVPAEELPYKRQQYQRLRALHGAAFDRQFMSAMVLSYEDAIRRFEAEAAQSASTPSRSFAAETLPQLRQRLDEARALLSKLEAPGN